MTLCRRQEKTSHLSTAAQWLSVLRLSHMWAFDDIRKTAIEELDRFAIDPVTKLEIAQKYELKAWKEAALLELVMREKPVSIGEARFLGLESTVKVAEIRDVIIKEYLRYTGASFYSRGHSPYDMNNIQVSVMHMVVLINLLADVVTKCHRNTNP